MNKDSKIKIMSYHYNLDKGVDFVLKNGGMWKIDEPPTGYVFYLDGTIIEMGNDSPYIYFNGDINIARKLHEVCFEKHNIYVNKDTSIKERFYE